MINLRPTLAPLLLGSCLLAACSAGGGDAGGQQPGLSIDLGTTTLEVDDVETLSVELAGSGVDAEDVTADANLKASDPIVRIEGKKLVAEKPGDAVVTASYQGQSANAEVHVLGFTAPEELGSGLGAVGSVIVAASDGRVYAFFEPNETATLHIFDPKKGWSAKQPFAFPGYIWAAAAIDPDHLLVVGQPKTNPNVPENKQPQNIVSAIYHVDTGAFSDVQTFGKKGPQIAFINLVMSSDGKHAAALIDYSTYQLEAEGVLLARWSNAGGWGEPVMLDPIGDAELSNFAMDDDGRATVVYDALVAKNPSAYEARVVFSQIGQPPSTPEPLDSALTGKQGIDCEHVAVDPKTGRGVISFQVETTNAQDTEYARLFVVDVAAGTLTSSATALDSTPAIENGCPTVAVLPDGDAYFLRNRYVKNRAPMELLHHRPGAGLVDTKSDWPAGSEADLLFARADGALWVGVSNQDKDDYFVTRRDPTGTWHDPTAYGSIGGAEVALGPDRTFGLLLYGSEGERTTVSATVYR